MQNKPELLLPVGNKEMALAAIHNGADAIFIGVPGFNARGRSIDHDIASLAEIINLCHQYRVKVNLAFNILTFQEELPKVVELLTQILPLKPDAFIVQDLGLVQIIRAMAPQQRVHASTQMTITNFESIELLEDLSIQRFVLGRENSIDEIKKIRAQTNKELEVFVHGALCVSYSGQCFTSESLGGRSANRGQCAQSCRFTYELHVDGEKKDLGDRHYLVSPQDLCGLDEIPALIEAGVNCFKVEGRLKTPDYVASSARAYRTAIQQIFPTPQSKTSPVEQNAHTTLASSFIPIDHLSSSNLETPSLASLKKNMAVSYSRGFFSGWLHGVNHQKLVKGHFSSHRGFELGTVLAVNTHAHSLTLKLHTPHSKSSPTTLVPGDGVLWELPNGKEQGGFIYGVKTISSHQLELEFSNEIMLPPSIVGTPLYQNHDKALKKSVAQSIEDKNFKKRLAISVILTFSENKNLLAQITDGEFNVLGESESPVQLARSQEVNDAMLLEEFNSLTPTMFKLSSFKVIRTQPQQKLFISHREIKKLRQKLISELTTLRQTTHAIPSSTRSEDNSFLSKVQELLSPSSLSTAIRSAMPSANENSLPKSNFYGIKFNLLLREKRQVSDLIDALSQGELSPKQIDTVILDFEFGRDYQSSLKALRTAPIKVGLATTRILKPNEYRNLKYLLDLQPDVLLVRNLGALHYLKQNNTNSIELRGDFSLNVTNHLTASYLLKKGLNSLCLSYDLNFQQISTLLLSTQASQMEVTIYQYMPSFHMEHCVFAAFLSEGSSYKDCGKPCEQHDVKLKDQFQNWHQIKPDQECRNTMYRARSQSAARFIDSWSEIGLGAVRFEALKENGNELISKIKAHLQFLDKKIDYSHLMSQLKSIESYGISEGSLNRSAEYQSIKKDLPL